MDLSAMDPNLQSVVLNVLSNGISTIIGHMGSAAKDRLRDAPSGVSRLDIPAVLRAAIAEESEVFEWSNPSRVEEVCLYLGTPEAESIVRQIFSATLLNEKKTAELKSIREEFISQLALYTSTDEAALTPEADRLFGVMTAACLRALDSAVESGCLAAHDAKSTYLHRVIFDELETVRKSLSLLTARNKPDISAFLDYEQKYREIAADHHKSITPPYVGAVKKIPIEQLYVDASLMPIGRPNTPPRALSSTDFLSTMYRAVILGNPGGGKSTFAQKLCYDLAKNYDKRILGGRKVTPILVILREYGSEKKERRCSILEHIETTARTRYQLPAPPTGVFEYLLLSGRAVVIFDGLDELLDTNYRLQISSDVERFCTLYPSVPVLVTSREVGYEQAPLDETRFDVLRLGDFGETQVREYVTKWFDIDTDLLPDQRKQKAEGFLRESRIVADLRSNPLMLALMCNIYRGENYIPRNRPDVYEKCATMLFEQWDKRRDIVVPLPTEIETDILPAMMYLAHWIYTDETLQSGVTERKLVAKAAEYLFGRRFEDWDGAERAARAFIDFCRGRAWVFTDTGTEKEGDSLYQFTHRTFLEYFTAFHVLRTHETVAALRDVLLPHIANREWDVVAQLAFQMKNRHSQDAGNELIESLLSKATESDEQQRWNLLSFAGRCLQFMAPRPKLVRQVTEACLNECIAWGSLRIGKRGNKEAELEPGSGHQVPALLGAVLYSTPDNRTTVRAAVVRVLTDVIDSGETPRARVAWELALNPNLPLYFTQDSQRSFSSPPEELREYWTEVSQEIVSARTRQFLTSCSVDVELCIHAFISGRVTLGQLLDWHGIAPAFREPHFSVFANVVAASPSELLAESVLRRQRVRSSADQLPDAQSLAALGRFLMFMPPPWVRDAKSLGHRHRELFSPQVPKSRLRTAVQRLDSDARFALFVILAIDAETAEWRPGLASGRSSPALRYHPLLGITPKESQARQLSGQSTTDAVLEELSKLDLDDTQASIALQWVLRQLSFVGHGSRARKPHLV